MTRMSAVLHIDCRHYELIKNTVQRGLEQAREDINSWNNVSVRIKICANSRQSAFEWKITVRIKSRIDVD